MTGATGNIYCRLHDFADMGFLLHLLQPGDLFLDVGANIGSYTVLASAVCGARTIAVEPAPETMASLKRNVDANHIQDRVQLVEAALGANNGTSQFTVGRDSTNRVAGEDDTETREVQMRSLDDLMVGMAPLFIKMDVEGHEAEVLRGATQTLNNPSLIAIETETSDAVVSKCLVDAGFRHWIYDPQNRRFYSGADAPGLARSSNALYLREVDTCRQRVEATPKRYIVGQQI